jgi:hypothetical protein
MIIEFEGNGFDILWIFLAYLPRVLDKTNNDANFTTVSFMLDPIFYRSLENNLLQANIINSCYNDLKALGEME